MDFLESFLFPLHVDPRLGWSNVFWNTRWLWVSLFVFLQKSCIMHFLQVSHISCMSFSFLFFPSMSCYVCFYLLPVYPVSVKTFIFGFRGAVFYLCSDLFHSYYFPEICFTFPHFQDTQCWQQMNKHQMFWSNVAVQTISLLQFSGLQSAYPIQFCTTPPVSSGDHVVLKRCLRERWNVSWSKTQWVHMIFSHIFPIFSPYFLSLRPFESLRVAGEPGEAGGSRWQPVVTGR